MASGDGERAIAIERYLARLELELSRVPPAERADIILETRSHLAERARRAPERAVDDVLAELGTPNEYAHRFLPDEPPPADRSRPGALHGIARLATGGIKWFPLLCVVAFAYAVAVLAVIIAVDKILEPGATGVFFDYAAGHRRFRGAVISDPHVQGREVLGYWLVPIMLALATAIHLAMRGLLRLFLRREERNRPSVAGAEARSQ